MSGRSDTASVAGSCVTVSVCRSKNRRIQIKFPNSTDETAAIRVRKNSSTSTVVAASGDQQYGDWTSPSAVFFPAANSASSYTESPVAANSSNALNHHHHDHVDGQTGNEIPPASPVCLETRNQRVNDWVQHGIDEIPSTPLPTLQLESNELLVNSYIDIHAEVAELKIKSMATLEARNELEKHKEKLVTMMKSLSESMDVDEYEELLNSMHVR